jgi:ElaB/YqjD/DUF883 family membrane-anchored ribosome-binding protein
MEPEIVEAERLADREVASVQDLLSSAEELLRSTAHVSDEAVELARQNFRAYLDAARETLEQGRDRASDQFHRIARSTDQFVGDRPWQAVGIALAAGLVAGLLVRR